MKQLESTGLQGHNSFSVTASCRRLFALEHTHDLAELKKLQLQTPLMLGAGSNILFTTDYPGDIILNRLRGRQIIDATDKHAYVRVQAGSDWHKTVLWSLKQGLSGLENLALIPGTAGAAPIQNIGAYGVEISDTLELVEVWDNKNNSARMMKARDCQLGYRDSLFRRQPDRYWILNITLKLSRVPRLRLGYKGLKQKLNSMGVEQPQAIDVANAVCSLRNEKLPNPAQLANAGSFFKNPIIDNQLLQLLLQDHPQLPHWPQENSKSKISAAWLIEASGWKGQRTGDAGVSPDHALILINYGKASGAEVWQLAENIRSTVKNKFNLLLEAEPRIIQAN